MTEALPAPDIEITREQEFVAPRDAIERIVANIWKNVLNLEKISVYDNFFEIGGNSLLVIQAVVSLEETFKIKFPAKKLSETHNIVELCKVLTRYETKPDQIKTIALLHEQIAQMSSDEVENALNS